MAALSCAHSGGTNAEVLINGVRTVVVRLPYGLSEVWMVMQEPRLRIGTMYMLNRIAPGLALGLDVTDYDSDSENGHVEHEVQAMAYSQSAIFGERDDERLDLFASLRHITSQIEKSVPRVADYVSTCLEYPLLS